MRNIFLIIRRWFRRKPKIIWVYGTCRDRSARRHLKNGNVQFVLWKCGEQGHKEDFWFNFEKSWWPEFIPYATQGSGSEDQPPCPEIPFFGAVYPDARCIDGYLWDLDKCDNEGNLYVTGDNPPCPFCNREQFMEYAAEEDDGGQFVNTDKIDKWIQKMREKYG